MQIEFLGDKRNICSFYVENWAQVRRISALCTGISALRMIQWLIVYILNCIYFSTYTLLDCGTGISRKSELYFSHDDLSPDIFLLLQANVSRPAYNPSIHANWSDELQLRSSFACSIKISQEKLEGVTLFCMLWVRKYCVIEHTRHIEWACDKVFATHTKLVFVISRVYSLSDKWLDPSFISQLDSEQISSNGGLSTPNFAERVERQGPQCSTHSLWQQSKSCRSKPIAATFTSSMDRKFGFRSPKIWRRKNRY